jgi:hypothetical protein
MMKTVGLVLLLVISYNSNAQQHVETGLYYQGELLANGIPLTGQSQKNLGDAINSYSMDHCPFIDIKTDTLYFTSLRNGNNSFFKHIWIK